MKPDPWCCICERYILDTDDKVRANKLVAHETCYLRAKKFFDSLNVAGQSPLVNYANELGRLYKKQTAEIFNITKR